MQTITRIIVAVSTATIAFTLPVTASAHKVIGIADGDTLTVLVDKQPVKLRLANIDAPEKNQAFGEAARQSLSDQCFGKDAVYEAQDTDRYGRVVAIVTCAGIEANRTQVERGFAWVYDKYNKDLTLPGLQAMAQRDRRGLWVDPAPIRPWEFRRPVKRSSAPSMTQSDSGICFIDRYGEYRLIDGKKRYGC